MYGVGFTIELGKLARRGVTFHLAIPVVIRPAAKFGGDLGAFFQRKPADGRFDFLNCAHGASVTFGQRIFKKDYDASSQIICG